MKITYRPEIDGLRAIAVCAVILYHAQFLIFNEDYFKGGFIGVDVFFVISGYLITSIIFTELIHKNKFSFSGFYLRRVRRILPALFVTMLVSSFAAWFFLLPSQFVDFADSILASIFFGANYYFHYSGQEYGAESSLLKPLLHNWSLSAEEQFYLIFPGIFVLCFFRFRRQMFITLVTVAIVSLVIADFGSRYFASMTFYSLPTRGWELLGGSVLAYAEYTRGKRGGGRSGQWLTALGFLSVLFSIAFFEEGIRHPSLVTCIPVIGTMMVIWFYQDEQYGVKILSSKLLRFVGLISYSLYLWHYPIFAFARVQDYTHTNFEKFAWIGATVALSLISYYLVERPFRNSEKVGTRALGITLITMAATLILISASVFWNDGYRNRFADLKEIYQENEYDNKILAAVKNSLLEQLAYDQNYETRLQFEEDGLWFSDSHSTTKLLIVGNSLSEDMFNAFYQNKDLFKKFEFARFRMQTSHFKDKEKVDTLFSSPNYQAADVILLSASYYSNKGSATKQTEAFAHAVNTIQDTGKKLVVASSSPIFKKIKGMPVFDYYIRNGLLDKKEYRKDLNRAFFKRLSKGSLDRFRQEQQLMDQLGVAYLNKMEFTCNLENLECDGITPDGFKVFFDEVHYTLEGAKYFGKKIFEQDWLKLGSL